MSGECDCVHSTQRGCCGLVSREIDRPCRSSRRACGSGSRLCRFTRRCSVPHGTCSMQRWMRLTDSKTSKSRTTCRAETKEKAGSKHRRRAPDAPASFLAVLRPWGGGRQRAFRASCTTCLCRTRCSTRISFSSRRRALGLCRDGARVNHRPSSGIFARVRAAERHTRAAAACQTS